MTKELEDFQCIVCIDDNDEAWIIARSDYIFEHDILPETWASANNFRSGWDKGLSIGVYLLTIKPPASLEDWDAIIDVVEIRPLWTYTPKHQRATNALRSILEAFEDPAVLELAEILNRHVVPSHNHNETPTTMPDQYKIGAVTLVSGWGGWGIYRAQDIKGYDSEQQRDIIDSDSLLVGVGSGWDREGVFDEDWMKRVVEYLNQTGFR